MKPTFNVREQSEIYIGPTADILSGVLPEGRVVVVSDSTIDRLYHSVLAQYDTVLIGLVLAYEQAGTSAAFWPTYAFNALTVGLGEAVACYGLGGLLLWRLDKSNALQRYLQNR